MRISNEKLYALFQETLEKFSSIENEKNIDQINYLFYEESEINFQTFLHEETLDRLYENGYIDDRIFRLCTNLRAGYFLLLEDIRQTKRSIIEDPGRLMPLIEIARQIQLK